MESKFSPIAWKLEDLAKDKYNQFTENTIAQLLAAAEIVRNHDVVRCGDCIYHGEIPCPVDIDMDTPTPDDWYCPCGVKMDGERKDGVEK